MRFPELIISTVLNDLGASRESYLCENGGFSHALMVHDSVRLLLHRKPQCTGILTRSAPQCLRCPLFWQSEHPILPSLRRYNRLLGRHVRNFVPSESSSSFFPLLTAVSYRPSAPSDIHRERFTVLDPETLVLQSAQEGLTSNQLQSRLRSRPVMPSAEEDLEERLAELGMVL